MTPILEATNLHKHFQDRPVLAGVDLVCESGQIVVIGGENGAGKSTLLRVVSGLWVPSQGEVLICGISLRRDATRAKASLGYLPDASDAFPDLLVSEFLALVRCLKSAPRTADQSWNRRLGVPTIERQRLGSLSLGQGKRALLAAAICGSPSLLVLDEPTNGLDPEGLALLGRLILERQANRLGTLVATNDAEWGASLGGPHYRLRGGKLAVGWPPRPDGHPST